MRWNMWRVDWMPTKTSEGYSMRVSEREETVLEGGVS